MGAAEVGEQLPARAQVRLIVDATEMTTHAQVALQVVHREPRVFLGPRHALGQLVGRPRGAEDLDDAQHEHQADQHRDHQLDQRQALDVAGVGAAFHSRVCTSKRVVASGPARSPHSRITPTTPSW